MSVITQNHILNIVPGMSAPVVVHVSQGDSGVELEFVLVNGSEIFDPTRTVISVHGIRQDGTGWGPVACAREDGKIKFTLPDAATAVKGSGMAELSISNGEETVGTTNFAILVETATFPQGVTYANDVSVYEAILAYVDQMGEQTVANVEADLAAEIANRQAADAVLQQNINSEASARSSADTTLQGNINAEATARANAVSSLNEALVNEITNRTNAVANEISARESADATINTRIDEIIAPSGEAPSAAEVTDARISSDGVTYSSLGKAIRTVTSIPKLFPFDVPIGTVLKHPSSNATVYDTGNAGIIKLKITALTPKAYKDFYVLNLYAYHASLHVSQFTVRSSDDALTFNYTSSARADSSNLPTEELTLYAADGSILEVTIDWSKINKANGSGIPNNTTNFKIAPSCIEIIPNVNINRLYPFDVSLDTEMKYPNSNSIVYSAKLCGIKNLHINTASNDEFYVINLYAYHSTNHNSQLLIRNKTNTAEFYYNSSARASSSELPTEELTLESKDGSIMTATIDWSKINTNIGVNIPNGTALFRISESCITRNDTYCLFSPISEYYITDEQQRIYMNEIADYGNDGYFTISVSGATYPEVTTGWNGESQYVEFNVTSTKDITITFTYRRRNAEIASRTITVHAIVGHTLPIKKYMFIGDSLTANGVYVKQFIDLNPNKVISYGTKTTLGVNHEGRSGWSAANYVNDASHGGETNPFYNPNTSTFDFGYYITSHPSFSDVDCVVIFLGRNDNYASSVITNLNKMITSILAYNSNIQTFVVGAYDVPNNNTGLGKNLQSCNYLNFIAKQYNRRNFYVNYDGTGDTLPIPFELNLDNKNDYSVGSQAISNVDSRTMEVYTDTVHPSEIGYKKFGYVLNSFFHYFFRSA